MPQDGSVGLSMQAYAGPAHAGPADAGERGLGRGLAHDGLIVALRQRTRGLHAEGAAEQSNLIGDVLRGAASRYGYALLLRNLLPAYQALEAGLERHRAGRLLAAVAQREVYRAAAIEADLAALVGTSVAGRAGRVAAARVGVVLRRARRGGRVRRRGGAAGACLYQVSRRSERRAGDCGPSGDGRCAGPGRPAVPRISRYRRPGGVQGGVSRGARQCQGGWPATSRQSSRRRLMFLSAISRCRRRCRPMSVLSVRTTAEFDLNQTAPPVSIVNIS